MPRHTRHWIKEGAVMLEDGSWIAACGDVVFWYGSYDPKRIPESVGVHTPDAVTCSRCKENRDAV